MPVPQETYMDIKDFDMENASTEQLMDEIIRITVIDYKALCAKIANPDIPDCEREQIDFLVAKYAMESKLVDGYLNKLQETMKDLPPGGLHNAIKQRELEILSQFNSA